ncbi:MAG: hypothetical protein A2139_11055 [Desulfobacca sp. RBG_16_60_12]|nr:MAG: hypothetical protein A2139_11055 [Desulfobacca sp. RBG_16_60_12]
MVGMPVKDVEFLPLGIVNKELQIYGVFLMKYAMDAATRILEAGLLPMDAIVTHRLPLAKVHEGLDLARRGEAAKVVLVPTEF